MQAYDISTVKYDWGAGNARFATLSGLLICLCIVFAVLENCCGTLVEMVCTGTAPPVDNQCRLRQNSMWQFVAENSCLKTIALLTTISAGFIFH
ncbi:hypothetical protein [Leptolyngbya ohadii]|uniref:hypothetical protein n=1 Tax=Leptolyngbya ohadii TaxID=1962290 RepID=UPI00117A7B40|nr:hypothetical protein [Leptolyngbya ohadii]